MNNIGEGFPIFSSKEVIEARDKLFIRNNISKDLEEINCELKSQIKENFKKANTLMQNKKDYPFERMPIW